MKKILFLMFVLSTSVFTYSQNIIRDKSFGNSGIVNTNYPYNSTNNNSLTRTILLNDHKFVGIGNNKIVRFNKNGTIDKSFGINGEFQIPNLFFNNVKLINNFYYFLGAVQNTTSFKDGLIFRATYDGVLDTTFGNEGYLTHHINENESFYNMVIDSNDKIIAVGIKKTYPWQKLFLTRFNSDGTIDTSFQNNGNKELYVFPMATERILNISKIENNRFFIACTGRNYINNENSELALLKLDTNGNFDKSFNNTGSYIMPTYDPFYFYAKFIDNKFYVININNDIYNSNYDASLFRIDLSDLSSQITVIDRDTYDYFVHSDSSISTLSMNRDQINVYPKRNLFIKKYHSNGNLDKNFNTTGIYEFNLSDINNFETDDIPMSIIFYDDKILVAGQSQIPQSGVYSNYTLTRFIQTTLSSNTLKKEKISLYPNPVLDYLKIGLKSISYPISIKIINSVNQVTFKSNIQKVNNAFKINIANLKSGIYILKIVDNEKNIFTKKFLKK